jgi:hypothetical protein
MWWTSPNKLPEERHFPRSRSRTRANVTSIVFLIGRYRLGDNKIGFRFLLKAKTMCR